MSLFKREEVKMSNPDPRYNLGEELRDTITNYKGVCTSVHLFLNGCIRYGLEAPMRKDTDKPDEGLVFDEQRLERLSTPAKEVKQQRTGGSRPTPSSTGSRMS